LALKLSAFLPNAAVELDGEPLRIFGDVLARIPEDTPAISSVTTVRLRRRGAASGLVGLTKYSYREGGGDDTSDQGMQSITFYTSLLEQLSSKAAMGVMAHELAHAWLNEHRIPEQSKAREGEADEVARAWGFGPEISALEEEADSYE
jgi:hypothetical protein